MGTQTVAVRTAAVHGPGTLVMHAPVAAGYGGYSLHDCTSPDQAGAHNMIWPVGSGATIGVPFSNTMFKQGLVVHTRDANTVATATVSVTTL